MTIRVLLLAALPFVMAACRPQMTPEAAPDDPYADWHDERLERLRSADGWLTLVGLHWLPEGASRVGSAARNEIVYEGLSHPEVGVFTRAGDQVFFTPAAEATVTGLTDPARPLETDAAETPTVLRVGTVTMHVIVRGNRYGVRMKDEDSALRRSFDGIARFPADPAWRIDAAFEDAAPGATIPVELATGSVSDETVAGYAVFTHEGVPCRMAMTPGADDASFFVVFGDATNGTETYGGGRFLLARRDGIAGVVLDFNQSYNPPCVFTPFATCPLPVPQNVLPFDVDAGERMWGTPHE